MKKYAVLLAGTLVLAGCQRQEDVGAPYNTETGSGAAGGIITTEPATPPPPPPLTPPSAPESPSVATTQTQDQRLTQEVRTVVSQGQTGAVAQNIQVTVENGSVVLRGTVQSEAEREQIEQRVREIQGIRSVQNELQVQSEADQIETEPTPPPIPPNP